MPEKQALVRNFNSDKKKLNLKTVLLVLVISTAGVATGYMLSNKSGVSVSDQNIQRDVSEGEITKGTTEGIADEDTFKDSAEGVLKKGGIDGEGSHHLERPGGESQNVYITSSVIDLDKYIDKEVKIWGETFSAKTAGWLMDVGKIKVL